MSEHITITVHIDAFAPGHLTPQKESFSPEALLETRTWTNTDDEQREAVLYLVRDGLTELLGRLDEWVPRSFHAESENRLDVKFSFDLNEIDNSVLIQQLRADRDMDAAASEIASWRADLEQ